MDRLCLNKYVFIDGKKSFFKSVFSFFLSIVLVTAIIRVPFFEIGLSTFFLIISLPYALYKISINKRFDCVIPVFLFAIITTIFSNNLTYTVVLSKLVFCIHLVGAFNGTIDYGFFSQSTETIACILTIMMMIQTICYYLFKINIVYLKPEYVLSENQSDVIKQYTILGFYRPSAIFLEPSHYAHFTIIALSLSLFYKHNIKKSLFIALGCLLTTSGLGIAMCFGAFVFYILFDERFRKKRFITIMIGLFVLLFIFLLLFQFEFFKMAFLRIVSEETGENAIKGRLFWWGSLFESFGAIELFFGSKIPIDNVYITGFMKIIYNHGIIGYLSLFNIIFFIILKKKSIMVTFLGILFLLLIIFANIYNLIFMSFWICTLFAYPFTRKEEPRYE